MYRSIICEPYNLDEVLGDVNQQGMKIVGTMYFSDTQQVCLIVEAEEEEKPISFLNQIKSNLRKDYE